METSTPMEESLVPDWTVPGVDVTNLPDGDDPEIRILCRTRSRLPAVPDIISEVAKLLVIDGQTLEVNFTLNLNHRFVPGEAPRTCAESVDDILWLPTRSMNLFQVDFPDRQLLATQNRLRARIKFERLGVPIVFGFRLKYREGPEAPRAAKKVVLLATIMPGSRDVTLTRV